MVRYSNKVSAKIGVGEKSLAEAHKELLEADTLEKYEELRKQYADSPRIAAYLDARIAEAKDESEAAEKAAAEAAQEHAQKEEASSEDKTETEASTTETPLAAAADTKTE